MNTNRQLGIITGRTGKSTEKLSSGYRVNRAADDAAGLSISEKMRSQIRGLDKASQNAEAGISVIQTAEGALNEVHAILQRMNELATQAANDTNTSSDRSQIQLEIDQLVSEIDRVASTTQFNTMDLLDGSFTGKNLQVGSLSGQNIEISINPMNATALKLASPEVTGLKTSVTSTGNFTHDITDPTRIKNDTLRYGSYTRPVPGSSSTHKTNNSTGTFSASLSDTGEAALMGDSSDHYYFYLKAGTSYDGTHSVSSDGWYALSYANGNQVTAKGQIGTSNVASISNVSSYITLTSGSPDDKDGVIARGGSSQTVSDWTNNNNAHIKTEDLESAYGITITGTPSDGDSIVMASSTYSSNGTIMVDSFEHAGQAMSTVQNAIDIVSTQRAKLGAIQNRLEYTIANLDNTAENTQAAESRIRDTDMASEMVNFSKNNILSQAGQSMLAQANQSAQSVLSLLA